MKHKRVVLNHVMPLDVCRKGKSCSSLFQCKNCGNPNGTRIVLPVGDKRKRKRRPHEFQKDVPKSKKFALERDELVSEQIWSTFECIILNNIILATAEQDHATILKHYNVFYSTTTYCTFSSLTMLCSEKKQVHKSVQN